ncbi:MAG TPA: hypothetical protein VN598_00340 [Usitatibacter sp.]|nr:hypothetical protein [Usitatibacter sp.]
MVKIIAATLLLWPAVAGAVGHADDLGRGPRYRIYFPPFKRVETENSSGRVTAIEVTVSCGYFTGVTTIPGDWWIQMRGPISGRSTLEASAGHGASYLWDLKTWDGSITVTPYDQSCFDVEAIVATDGPDETKAAQTKYTRMQLKLQP